MTNPRTLTLLGWTFLIDLDGFGELQVPSTTHPDGRVMHVARDIRPENRRGFLCDVDAEMCGVDPRDGSADTLLQQLKVMYSAP